MWLSLPFGIIISIVCLTGAILVFETEITEYVQRDMYYVKEVKEKALPIDTLKQMVEPTLDEDVTITQVIPSSAPNRTYKLTLSKPRRAAIYVDQYTGEVMGQSSRLAFFAATLRLHRFLMGTRDAESGIFWGKTIVGVSVLLFVFILLTGIVLWWPQSTNNFCNHIRIHTRYGWRRFWYDLHAVGGMYVLIVLLLLALTGLTWSFSWFKTFIYSHLSFVSHKLIYSMHVGTWGGMPTRILTLIAAIIGAILPLTGYYLWIKRLFVGKKK